MAGNSDMAEKIETSDNDTGTGGGDVVSKSVASQVPFQDFCGLLERIQSLSGTERKKGTLDRFIKQWRDTHNKLHQPGTTHSDSFYPAMRLLLPYLDRQRPAYGLKEVSLAKQYIDILKIAKDSTDAKKLLNYRTPHAAQHDATDFAGVAYFVLRNRCPEKGSLSMEEVNQCLDELALSNVTKDRGGVKKSLQYLLRNTSAQEQKWLIRIIMKELKIGLSENSILTVFHCDGLDLFSVTSSLEKVCVDLHSPTVRLNEAAISYFTPFRPMLGQRATIDQVVKLMDYQSFFIENKFDGERIQLHKQQGQYRYYSRSSREYSSTFGGTEREGSFTPNIHKAFNSKVHSCILDGEMVGWDNETETYLPKGDNVDVKTLAPAVSGGGGGVNSVQPCYVVFDVLMINDTNLANCPLRERVEHLNKIFEVVPGCLHRAERIERSTKEDVILSLNEAIDRREEGLVIKQPSSLYKPDKRKGSGWLKIKPDYVDSLSDDLDLLIIGGYFGVGRRAGMISHFMCGVAVPPTIKGDKPTVFHSFCKVGSGYTMNELRELGHKLKPYWRKFDTKRPPESVILAAGFKEKPDLWIEPSDSKIVQIRAAEIIVSDKYRTGCTLRFPRLERMREDKEWFDCMSLDELEDLKRVASGHLAHRHYEEGEGEELTTSKKRRRVTRVDRPTGVASQFRHTDVSSVEEVSSMFAGKEFCVINGTPSFNKQYIETKIAEHGGTFVQNPTGDTYCVLVHKLVVKANNIISKGIYNVVMIQWFLDCLETGRCLPLKPSLMYSTSFETASKFSEIYDKYGDSYIDDTSETTLREIFDKMKDKRSCSAGEIAKIEFEYFPNESDKGLFRHFKFYFDKYEVINEPSTVIINTSLSLSELDVRLCGGTVTDDFNESVTHIVFDKSDLRRLSSLRLKQKSHSKKSHFITSEWISACIEHKYCKNERLFEPIITTKD